MNFHRKKSNFSPFLNSSSNFLNIFQLFNFYFSINYTFLCTILPPWADGGSQILLASPSRLPVLRDARDERSEYPDDYICLIFVIHKYLLNFILIWTFLVLRIFTLWLSDFINPWNPLKILQPVPKFHTDHCLKFLLHLKYFTYLMDPPARNMGKGDFFCTGVQIFCVGFIFAGLLFVAEFVYSRGCLKKLTRILTSISVIILEILTYRGVLSFNRDFL